ncbi:hypothetical protein FZC66_08285 [Priestia megaterium]|nr:hypothetical protein FZC66_08285 [Priestia megaterium]
MIKAWFYRFVVNTSLDVLRKKKKVTVMDDETIEWKQEGHEDHYENLDLKQSLEERPLKYRTVVVFVEIK